MVESGFVLVVALAVVGIVLAALGDVAERRRTRQRAETVRRFTPEPLAAPLLVPVRAGGAGAAGDEPRVGGRRDEFLALGLDELEALEAAAEIDVEEFRGLVRRGCPPRVALQILR